MSVKTTYIIRCDRCGHPERMPDQDRPPTASVEGHTKAILPLNWNVVVGRKRAVDLCPICARAYAKWVEEPGGKPIESKSLAVCRQILKSLRTHDGSGPCTSVCKYCALVDLADDAIEEERPKVIDVTGGEKGE